MEVELRQQGDVTVATLFGELDGRSAPDVQEKLLALPEPDGKLLLDMGGVSYISSAGLRALLMLYRQIEGQDGRVGLVRLPESIKDMMTVTGFLDFFAAYETIDEALTGLDAASS